MKELIRTIFQFENLGIGFLFWLIVIVFTSREGRYIEVTAFGKIVALLITWLSGHTIKTTCVWCMWLVS